MRALAPEELPRSLLFPCQVLLWREAMTALLAARRQNLAATYGLHAHAKSVCLGAASFPRLICTLWQSIPPLNRNPVELLRTRQTSCPDAQAAFCHRFPPPAALALESSLVQPDYPGWGSIRNLLVYLSPTHRVNKTPGVRVLGGEK